MQGSPTTFLPRTLFSEDDADSGAETDAHTEGGWDAASEAMRKAQRSPQYPSENSLSSDDEDGPLHWSGFHAQIEALLKTVQKQPPRDGVDTAQTYHSQFSMDDGDFSGSLGTNSQAGTASDDGESSGAASDSSADELLAYMTGNTATRAAAAAEHAAQQKAHSEVYGHPLPSWLFELATTVDATSASGSQEATIASGPHASTTQHPMPAWVQEGTPGRLQPKSTPAGARKALPEWLTSPARPAQPHMDVSAGSFSDVAQLPEAVAHTPFKSLIEEIEANLAAGFASQASTSFLYNDEAASQPGNESLHWFTNELARAAAEAQEEIPLGGPASSVDGLAGDSAGQVSTEEDGCRTPYRQLPVFQEELAELDPLAHTTEALESFPANNAELDCRSIAASPAVPCVDAKLAVDGSPAKQSEAGEASPLPQQGSGSPLPSYRILRPSVSPRSSGQLPQPPGWGFLWGEPASQEKGGAESSEADSSSDDDVPSEAVHMLSGRRVLGELNSNSPLERSFAAEAHKPSPRMQVFEDDAVLIKGAAAAPRPDEDRLTAVYAQIDALSRDLRGTHDELEQLRHAEAQLKGIYEGMAQQQSSPGVTAAQGSMSPMLGTEWAAHISPQQMVELEAAKRVLAQRLDTLSAELADKDARLAHITAQLHHAREQLAAKQREADVLLGETLGLQDVLTEAGAEAAATAAQLAALGVQLERSQARVQEVEAQLAEREAELAQCRGQLLRTEELLEKARQAAAKQLLADAAKPAAALPQTGSPAGKHAAEKDFSLAAGDVAGTGAGRARPSSAEELSRAMVTPPLAERRAADREGSIGLTPPFTPSLEPTHRQAPAPFPTNPSSNGKSPAWAAGTPMLRPGQPFAAQRPRATPGGRSAWDIPSPSPMGPSSASNAALASVLAAIRARECRNEGEKGVRMLQASLPDTPLASVLRRMNSRSSMEGAAVV
ncbi:hypothetical protein COCSUDRAFT_55544 [Coccomyxa subellipsoidea C-169]|uniref:Uncharacterized protein n=1 Tax=Coccomyxa subellipsoidea (strain C-169) TaxID=574566 RepID=I0ZA77_COCSC|nr:hypothetical protein COCSUDRAFT_55544 [Coccomyxa subellipsoidea C-169]EIE27546.1 hypothetical protein COCSUDRAFT_55544 [Coccomyxa subellipsoidea C-169]|eukprot:XP_005652090.1 hypothetical protein COCSUDRAFT_55544 [Coccomyxa subellipsoidea C-169]